jgi:hypothetical protein
MNPTPTELALIAAALSQGGGKKPQDNLADAQKLWFDASNYLAEQAALKQARRKPKIQPLISYGDFLKSKMPKLMAGYRRKKFYEYLVEHHIPKVIKGKPSAPEIANCAREFIDVAKKEGLSAGAYPDFQQWNSAKISASKAENARKMHEKRKGAKKIQKIQAAANRQSREKKTRIEYHPPEILALIAEKEQHLGGGNLQD